MKSMRCDQQAIVENELKSCVLSKKNGTALEDDQQFISGRYPSQSEGLGFRREELGETTTRIAGESQAVIVGSAPSQHPRASRRASDSVLAGATCALLTGHRAARARLRKAGVRHTMTDPIRSDDGCNSCLVPSFSNKFREARSRLYRRRHDQVKSNTKY